MANEISTEITLDLKQFMTALKQAEKAGKDAGDKTGEGFGGGLEKVVGGLFSIKTLIAGLGASLIAAFSVKEIVGEAIEAENAMHKLRASFSIAGVDAASASEGFRKFAENLQKTTGFSDDAIIKNASLLVSIGKLTGEGLERATVAAANLSAGLGISLDDAMEKVARAASGNVEQFGRLGIHIKNTGNAAADFQTLLSRLEGTFGGMAQNQINTFGGAMTKLSNSFHDLLENLGNIIIKSPVLTAIIKALSSVLDRAAQAVAEFAGSGDHIGNLIKKLLELSRVIIQNVGPPVELLFNVMKTGILTTITGLTMMVQGLTVVGQAILDVLRQPILDTVAAVGKLVSLFDKDLGASFQTFAASTIDSTQTALAQLNTLTESATNSLTASTSNAANSVFTFDVTATAEAYNMQVQEFVAAVTPVNQQAAAALTKPFVDVVPSTWSQIIANVKAQLIEMSNFVKQLSNAMVQSIRIFATGLSTAFASVGANLVNGGAAFKDFGKILLGVLGDIAIQFGATFILMGIAKTLLFDPTGPALIAAGAALSVIGGALKALGGGAGISAGPAAAGTGAGVNAAGGGGGVGSSSFGATEQQQTEQKQGPSVNVTVQGNVLDRRQTGLEIAEVINEAFGSNGVNYA